MARQPQQANAELDREKSKNNGALRGLRPFLAPYRFLVVLALCALTLTASVSLMLPVAVRPGAICALSSGFTNRRIA